MYIPELVLSDGERDNNRAQKRSREPDMLGWTDASDLQFNIDIVRV
jgi:hypothetical protein